MMMNCVDPEVAEYPEELVVYGGTGKAARNWEAFWATANHLRMLGEAETLVIQSGKPVAIFETTPRSPRVVMSTAMLVPRWATWPVFRELESKNLTCFGQATASSWAYIGAQGIVQATGETFSEIAGRHFDGSLRGRLVLTAGLGGMGAAQPLGVALNGGVALVVEVDEGRIRRRLRANCCDIMARGLEEALSLAMEAKARGVPRSVALLGNAADVLPQIAEKGVVPDVVTDQTSAHDILYGYVPAGLPYPEALALRQSDPERYKELALASIARHVGAMLDFLDRGSVVFDYGNAIRLQASRAGVARAFDFPGFVPGYLRRLYAEGYGQVRWIALSGDPGDIYAVDDVLCRRFPENGNLRTWVEFAQSRVAFQGLPARACWLDYEQRCELGGILHRMVASGRLRAPLVVTRDLSHAGAEASPYRESEDMPDGSDTIADWPILNALLNVSAGASLVSVNHGTGVGIGNAIHAGYSVVVDGSPVSREKTEAVLAADSAFNTVRLADAGVERAIAQIDRMRARVPMTPATVRR